MITELDRSRLTTRHVFSGALIMDTALHIGGGRDSSSVSDSPIVRDGLGRPVIPGSSFKGAFRAAVERLLPNVPNARACGLTRIPRERVAPDPIKCLTVREDLDECYGEISKAVGQGSKLPANHPALVMFGRQAWDNQILTEEHLLDLLAEFLCDTCKTFGSPRLAAVVLFNDLPVSVHWTEMTQIRDGVGIDRDSERAVEQIKYDYEVVPAQTEFDFRMTVENPTRKDLALVALGLCELMNGMVPLGGIRSRGLGHCHLHEVKQSSVNFADAGSLRNYLIHGWPAGQPLEAALPELLAPFQGDWGNA